MTKEEFVELQFRHQESGKTLKEYLKEIGVGYSTYNYWRKKLLCDEEPHELAPISFMGQGGAGSLTHTFSLNTELSELKELPYFRLFPCFRFAINPKPGGTGLTQTFSSNTELTEPKELDYFRPFRVFRVRN